MKMTPLLLLLPLLSAACDVSITPNMLEGDLLSTLRTPEFVSELCGTPLADDMMRVVKSLRIENIQATRPLMGKEGHGTAHVSYPPAKGAECKGDISYDFSQEARKEWVTKRHAVTHNSFYFGNVVVKK